MLKNIRRREDLDDNQWYFIIDFLFLMTNFFFLVVVLNNSIEKILANYLLTSIYEFLSFILFVYYCYFGSKIKIRKTDYSSFKWSTCKYFGVITFLLAFVSFLPFLLFKNVEWVIFIIELYFVSLEITFIIYVITLEFPYKGLKNKNFIHGEGFYTLFSRKSVNIQDTADCIFNISKVKLLLNLGIHKDKIEQRNTSNIINNLNKLHEENLNAYLHLKNKVKSLSDPPFWNLLSSFISFLGIVLSCIFGYMKKQYTKKYFINSSNLYKLFLRIFSNIQIFFLLSLLSILFVIIYLLIKYFIQQKDKESYSELYMYFKESENQDRLVLKLRPMSRIFINSKRIK